MEQSKEQQRTFAHVLFAARELTRLELVPEAVRALLEHLATVAPQILDELVTDRMERTARAGRCACAASLIIRWPGSRRLRLRRWPRTRWSGSASASAAPVPRRPNAPPARHEPSTSGLAASMKSKNPPTPTTDSDHRPRPPTAFGGHAEFPSDSSRTPPTDLALG